MKASATKSFSQGFRPHGHPLGLHRVMAPSAALPQAAKRLDATLPPYDNELLIEVERLNLDSASFQQFWAKHHGDENALKEEIFSIVHARGKLENPVTGSGGMLLGRIAAQGDQHPNTLPLGTLVASLVSLSLTPLRLNSLTEVHPAHAQIKATGSAILFEQTALAPVPKDLPESLALSALDVCGAPAWVKRLIKPTDHVLILGFGKAGRLSALAALEKIPPQQLMVIDASEAALQVLNKFPPGIKTAQASAKKPLEVLEHCERAHPGGFDLVIQTCSAPETETAALLAARPGANVVFFNMATNFSRTVLSAEALAKDLNLIMGTGFVPGHAEDALGLLGRNLEVFEEE